MKIYVLTFEPTGENSLVVGTYSSIEKAIEDAATWTDGSDMGWKAPEPGTWQREGVFIDEWENAVAQATVDDAHNQHALIFEMELDG